MRTAKWGFVKNVAIAGLVAMAGLVAVEAQAANKLIVKGTDGVTDKFVVADTGQVGIGTNAPSGAIHFNGSSYATTQFIGQFTGNPPDPHNGGSGFVGFHNNAGGTLPLAGDRLGYFLFGSLNGTTRLIGGGMTVKAEADWTPTNFPASITFDTVATTGRIERLKITGAGNIGIGIAAPTQKLEINGGVKLNTSIARPACDSTVRGTIWVVKGAVGVADTLAICLKGDGVSTENYAWKGL